MAGDTTATLVVDLETEGTDEVTSAASALKDLRKAIDADTAAVVAMQKALRNLKGGGAAFEAQANALKTAIAAKNKTIAQSTSSYLQLGGTFKKTSGSGGAMKSMFEQLSKQAGGVPGPIGGILSKLGSLQGLVVGGAITLGILGIVSALAALTIGATVATLALLKYGVAQADARRSELLRLEGLTKLRNWYGIAAGSATEMQKSIDGVSSRVPIAREQVAQYGAQLYKAGLRGQQLADALEGAAIKAAVHGEKGANAFMGMAVGAAFAGQSVKKLSDDVKARLGGIVARQMLSLDVQSAKLKESFAAIFNGLQVEGLLRALNLVTALFSQNTASGRALKAIVEIVFQPMIGAVEYLGPLVKRFFQGMIIGALHIIIVLLQVRNWFKKTFGDSEILKGFDTQNAALLVGKGLLLAMAGAAVILMGGFLLLATPMLVVAHMFYTIYKTGKSVYDLFTTTNWSGAGKAICEGIVNGINSGKQWVFDTLSNLGAKALKSFKAKLGIASPSKEFAKLGVALPQGVSKGVDAGTPGMNRTIEGMVDIPNETSGSSTSNTNVTNSRQANNTKSDSSKTVHIENLHLTAKSDSPQDLLQEMKRLIEGMFEDAATQMGAEPV